MTFRVISSDSSLRVGYFESFVVETYLLILRDIPWFELSPTMHKVNCVTQAQSKQKSLIPFLKKCTIHTVGDMFWQIG